MGGGGWAFQELRDIFAGQLTSHRQTKHSEQESWLCCRSPPAQMTQTNTPSPSMCFSSACFTFSVPCGLRSFRCLCLCWHVYKDQQFKNKDRFWIGISFCFFLTLHHRSSVSRLLSQHDNNPCSLGEGNLIILKCYCVSVSMTNNKLYHLLLNVAFYWREFTAKLTFGQWNIECIFFLHYSLTYKFIWKSH